MSLKTQQIELPVTLIQRVRSDSVKRHLSKFEISDSKYNIVDSVWSINLISVGYFTTKGFGINNRTIQTKHRLYLVGCKWNRLLAFDLLSDFLIRHEFFYHWNSRWDECIEVIFILMRMVRLGGHGHSLSPRSLFHKTWIQDLMHIILF